MNTSRTTRTLSSIVVSSSLTLGLVAGLAASLTAGPAHARSSKKAAAPQPSQSQALSFTRLGKGPAVVLVHGLGADRAMWSDEIVRLSQNHTVLAIDLPGHGQTAAPRAGEAIDLPRIAHQITQLIRSEKLEPATVIGHSLGGTLALWTPIMDEGAVRGVVIVDAPIGAVPVSPEERKRLRYALKFDGTRALRDLYTPIARDNVQVARLVATATHVPADTFVGYIDSMSESRGLDERVRDLQVPVELIAGSLLTSGTQDKAQAEATLRASGYGELAHLTVDYFPQAKHWIFWDDPKGYTAAVDKFLASVEKTSPNVAGKKGPDLARRGGSRTVQ